MNFRSKHLKQIVALCVTILMVLNMAIINVAAESGLNAKMYWTQNLSQDWSDVESTTAIFDTTELDVGSETLRYIKVENAGSLDFSYQIKFVSENEISDLADAIDVYYLPDVSTETEVSAMTKIGTLSQVINGESISTGYISPEGIQRNGYAEKESVIAVALKMHQNADASLMGKKVDFDIKLTATDANKFYTKFKNTDKYLYRVGNANAVSLGSLFGMYADAQPGNVSVEVKPLDEGIAVSGTYTADSSNWTNGKIQFSGTGPVVVTISDDKMAVPLALNLEVVNAENVTAKTDVKDKNIVLLNDISGTFTVSNGYAVYGNGFTVRCAGNGSYRAAALSYGFITLENGVLDNVSIVCDIFPKSYLYTKEMDAGSDGRYPYGNSAVVVTGSSRISNCYIYGARNNILVSDGNVTIENTVTECGSLSNIQIKGTDANTVTLDNVTTIQYQTTSSYDTSSKVLGFGVVVGDNESVSNSKIKLKGDLKQYNWVTSDDTSVSNTYAKSAIQSALKETDYQHTINDKTAVNMGIAYLNGLKATIEDERDNKSAVPYVLNNITMSGVTGQVYSISNSGISAESRYSAQTDGVLPYAPSENGYILPTAVFDGVQNDAINLAAEYDKTKGAWISKLAVDLDNIDGGSYDFKFEDIKVQKYGKDLEFTVADSSGNSVNKSATVTLNELYTGEYTFTITDNQLYDASGNKEANEITTQIPFVLNATKTSIEPPKFTIDASKAEAYRLVDSAGGDWRPAYSVLDGVSVDYWSASEKKTKTVDLTTIYNKGTTSSNVWTYTCDDYTLTITGGQVHSDGTKITPMVSNNKLYFVSTNKAFGTGTTSRDIILTYVFTDKNASTTKERKEKVTYSELAEYSYDKFKKGTLEAPSSGGSGCFTPDALITLADGSQKRIDELTFDDDILVWDFFNGEYTVSKPSLLINDGVADYDVITLSFDDGTSTQIIYEHGFFDVDVNDYVYINKDNVHEFVGHTFIKNEANTNVRVKVTGYDVTNENIGCYTILTAQYNNCIANGLLTVTPPPIEGFYDYFEIGEGMKYDSKLMAEDIEKYGLYTYEDFADYISYEEFVAFNGAYLKLPVEKGYFTFADILEQVKAFGVGVVGDDEEIEPTDEAFEDMGIMPMAEDMYLATDIVISANNTVCAATYAVVATGDGYADGTITADECTLTLSAGGTASNGYAKLTIDDESYYTVQIPNGSSIDVVFKNAEGRAVSVTPYWGNSADYGISQENLVASGDVFNMSFYISAVQNGTNGVDAVLVNNSKDDVTADVYVAVYESSGKMVDFARTNMTVTKADKTRTYESNIAMPEGGYAKAFVWNTGAIVPMIDLLSTK